MIYQFPIVCPLLVAQSALPPDKGEWVSESEHGCLRVVYEAIEKAPPGLKAIRVATNLKIWKPGSDQKVWKVHSVENMGLYKGDLTVATLLPVLLHGMEWLVFYDPVTQEVIAKVEPSPQPNP